ncbi:MAG: flagellin FliC [Sterolibacteriaceae bacterium]|uniref:Flagellin n=1 Tax=Candidatus Methylophosphatis roskildensis TaxID=2899263 RepID=A0A9D7DXG4_9PROT|nr:flagellin FliC [Candidatus Methylophosphatis roskildensis]MBK7235850.1 flagellin FliC [Sterolibacteriaceae bacterium]
MPQIINTNVAALNSARNLSNSQSALATSLQRLSSGMRVNSAKDDAAGLAIAERMNSQVRGMNVAIRNANDGISYAQTAEGALAKVGDALQRMRELAVQSRNSTNSDSDKNSLNTEFGQMQDEITRLLSGTKFNNAAIFATSGSINFQVGAGTTGDDSINVNFGSTAFNANATITAVTGSTAVIGSSADAAAIGTVIDNLDTALNTINEERGNWGARQTRFESVISNLQVSVENQSAARSRIMDADFAAETAALSRNQILQQAGTAMLAQANALPQNVLSLLR